MRVKLRHTICVARSFDRWKANENHKDTNKLQILSNLKSEKHVTLNVYTHDCYLQVNNIPHGVK